MQGTKQKYHQQSIQQPHITPQHTTAFPDMCTCAHSRHKMSDFNTVKSGPREDRLNVAKQCQQT